MAQIRGRSSRQRHDSRHAPRLRFNYREAVRSNQFAYAGELEACLWRWTIAGGVERAGIKDVWTSPTTTARFAGNTYLVGASFYSVDELRLDARANILETDVGRIYSAGVEWRPAVYGLPISARFSYSRVTGHVVFAANNLYGISLTYFFAPPVSLLSLDRAFLLSPMPKRGSRPKPDGRGCDGSGQTADLSAHRSDQL